MADGNTHPTPAAATAPAKSPTRRDLAKAATARRILDAALAEFVLGYDQATMRGIAARAGMSTGAIFANYPDKAALYRAAFGHAPITPEVGRELRSALKALLDSAKASQVADARHLLARIEA